MAQHDTATNQPNGVQPDGTQQDPGGTQQDEAAGKGAVEGAEESAQPDPLATQLGHRDQNDLLKDNDTDFPEPDAAAEHS
jgi:hypothetical protein